MNTSTPQAARKITPIEFHALRGAGTPCELLDVRTPPEYTAAHVPGAILAPLDDLDPATILGRRADPSAPLHIICQSGSRARSAIERFRSAGFEQCVLVEGGTQAWEEAGLPLERGASRVLPLQRQVHLAIGFFTFLGAALALAVDARFAILPLLTGSGLLVNGSTGWCGLALLIAKLPWNRLVAPATCSL